MAVLGPTPDEVARLQPFFAQADADGDGLVGVREGAAFFKMSGLPSTTLREIWKLATPPDARQHLGLESFEARDDGREALLHILGDHLRHREASTVLKHEWASSGGHAHR